jgi:predicted DNA-binding protein
MSCCMSATRTQILLTEEQRRQIDALAEAEGVTMAEIVRRALDAYLDEESPDPELALAPTFAADPGAAAPSRDEWGRG